MKLQFKKDKREKQSLQFIFNKFEIIFLAIIIGIHQILVTKIIVDYAQQHPQKTSPSYLTNLIGKNRDSHDIQWQTYRTNLPILILCMIIWYGVSIKIEKYKNEKSWILGCIILAYSFRSDLIIYLTILTLWYFFTISFSHGKYFVGTCWVICIGLLYLNEFTHHFQYLSQIIGSFMPFEQFSSINRQISCGQVLNMTFLKLLSFSIDMHRGSQKRQLQKHQQTCLQCSYNYYCLKGRNFISTHDFTYKSYMNYLLFAPTLLTGPPLSYKNFISFHTYPSNKQPEIFKCIFLFISFEIYQHYCPVIQLNQTQTFIQAQIMALFHLVFIWFKFLIIWKVGRLWSALCGIQVIDNLSRCVCNNYGFQGFWRMWHRGFNQWLVRYLYIPLGGNTNIFSVISTIAFVAFWHDHTINIVIWAFALIIFILPEILIKRYARKYWRNMFGMYWFKYMAAFVSAVYIYFLVFSNIIGFGYGMDKLDMIWEKVRNQWLGLIYSIFILMCAVILMFYQRSIEIGDKNY